MSRATVRVCVRFWLTRRDMTVVTQGTGCGNGGIRQSTYQRGYKPGTVAQDTRCDGGSSSPVGSGNDTVRGGTRSQLGRGTSFQS